MVRVGVAEVAAGFCGGAAVEPLPILLKVEVAYAKSSLRSWGMSSLERATRRNWWPTTPGRRDELTKRADNMPQLRRLLRAQGRSRAERSRTMKFLSVTAVQPVTFTLQNKSGANQARRAEVGLKFQRQPTWKRVFQKHQQGLIV